VNRRCTKETKSAIHNASSLACFFRRPASLADFGAFRHTRRRNPSGAPMAPLIGTVGRR
jgi:hypothetical protein